MQPNQLPVTQQIALLVRALDGAKRTNEALANCVTVTKWWRSFWEHRQSLVSA